MIRSVGLEREATHTPSSFRAGQFSVSQKLHLQVGVCDPLWICLKYLDSKKSQLVKWLGYIGLLLRRRSGLLHSS